MRLRISQRVVPLGSFSPLISISVVISATVFRGLRGDVEASAMNSSCIETFQSEAHACSISGTLDVVLHTTG